MNSNTDKTPLVISYLFTGESFFLRWTSRIIGYS